jgi:ATP-dependent Clp protease protease subunit
MRNRLNNLLRANAKRGSFKAESNTIFLYDVIVGDEFEAEVFGGISPKGFADVLSQMSGPVSLRINSPGGDVFAASAMSQAIREYGSEVVAHVDGVAASAASVIATAASKVVMAPGSLMMIHNAWTMAVGDAGDLRETADLLEKVDGMLANHYAKRAKGDTGTFADMMAKETWMTPEEAVEAGLADEVAKNKPKNLAAWDLSAFGHAPQINPEEADPIAEIQQRVRAHQAAMLLKTA